MMMFHSLFLSFNNIFHTECVVSSMCEIPYVMICKFLIILVQIVTFLLIGSFLKFLNTVWSIYQKAIYFCRHRIEQELNQKTRTQNRIEIYK